MEKKVNLKMSQNYHNGPWAALEHRDFRLLWTGNTSSQFGDQMQQMAQYWLIWQLTSSPTALGLAAFVSIIPRLVLGIFVGPLVDNLSKRTLLRYTQWAAFLLAMGFSLAVLLQAISLLLALVFILLLEATQTVNQIVRQALIQDLVPRSEIASAISLNTTGNNLAKIVGPSIGGILIPIFGTAGLMIINSFTFLAILVAIWFMDFEKDSVKVEKKKKASFKEELKEGYQYIWRNRNLRMLIYLSMISALLIMPYNRLLPAYVDMVLKKGPLFMGFLTSSFGLGAVLGAMNSANVRSKIGTIVTVVTAFAQGVAIILFGLSYSPYLSLVTLFFLGMATMIYSNSVMTAMQLSTEPEYVGRVMSIFLLNRAVSSMGALTLGVLGSLLGVGWAYTTVGVIYLIFGSGVQFANRQLGAEALSPAVRKKGHDS